MRVPEYFAKQTIFGLEADQARREQATRGKRRPVQLAISQDVALSPGITRHELVLQP